jgi:predicted DNA-binding transcriptional regulator AlpA
MENKHAAKPDALPDALTHYDDLPRAAHIRDKVVAALLSCSVPTVWRMAKDGRLPRPRKLSERVTAWNVGELRDVLSAAR